MNLETILTWQFSLGFALGLVAGTGVVLRAVRDVARESRERSGYRGYTPPNAGRPILPQGGSGTAPPRNNFKTL